MRAVGELSSEGFLVVLQRRGKRERGRGETWVEKRERRSQVGREGDGKQGWKRWKGETRVVKRERERKEREGERKRKRERGKLNRKRRREAKGEKTVQEMREEKNQRIIKGEGKAREEKE